jgi:hypothetical protein
MFAPDGRPRIDRQMLAAKAEHLDKMIRKLSAMRDGLRHAAACPPPSHMECPSFSPPATSRCLWNHWTAKQENSHHTLASITRLPVSCPTRP